MSTSSPLTLELFTDFVCPWCYLGNAVLNQLLTNSRDLKVRRTPFPLHPSTPDEGLPLAQLLPGRDLEQIHQRLYVLMDELGLEHGQRSHTYNSRLAQELALWADTQVDSGRPLDALLYRAYFVHDRNLADPQVLLSLVAEAGLDTMAAESVLQQRTFSAAVDSAWERARRFGISAVPTFVAGGYMNSGFMPLSELQRFVKFVEDQAQHPA